MILTERAVGGWFRIFLRAKRASLDPLRPLPVGLLIVVIIVFIISTKAYPCLEISIPSNRASNKASFDQFRPITLPVGLLIIVILVLMIMLAKSIFIIVVSVGKRVKRIKQKSKSKRVSPHPLRPTPLLAGLPQQVLTAAVQCVAKINVANSDLVAF